MIATHEACIDAGGRHINYTELDLRIKRNCTLFSYVSFTTKTASVIYYCTFPLLQAVRLR